MITFGSVTHRDLFLQTPIRLPLFNVELSLIAFFVVAPAVLVIFHFYVLLYLTSVAEKAKVYEQLLRVEAPVLSARELLRQRLDTFVVLQSLVGTRSQRSGFVGLSLKFIMWLTLFVIPILVLLQGEATFLAYHLEWVTWLHRICVLMDLCVIWAFWFRVKVNAVPFFGSPLKGLWHILGVGLTAAVILFCVAVTTFPGEWANDQFPGRRAWTLLRDPIFHGAVDEVTGVPRSVFSNRLVITDQSFVDYDKIDKVDNTRSLRGRDLRQAVLNRADLRKVDFTGAMLNGAQFVGARLEGAHFDCAPTGKGESEAEWLDQRETLPWPDNGCTWMEAASFDQAQLQGAVFYYAHLEDASFSFASLQGVEFAFSFMQGVDLSNSSLQAAHLGRSKLQGASLLNANLQGATLFEAQLQGADLTQVNAQGAYLNRTDLGGASLVRAHLQEANLSEASLKGATLEGAEVWRAHGVPETELTDITGIDLTSTPWDLEKDSLINWRKKQMHDLPENIRAKLLPFW